MTMIPFPGTFHGEREELTTMFPVARLGLRVIAGPLRGQQFTFDGGSMVIGRGTTSNVTIPSKGVSRTHARIEYADGNYWLFPEKTVNGTRLNGVLVTAPSQLTDRDQIAIHDSTFVVAFRETEGDFDAGPVAPPPGAAHGADGRPGQPGHAAQQGGQGYPPSGQNYPPSGQNHPPSGQNYPPSGQGYPSAGQSYPPAGQGYPPAGQGYSATYPASYPTIPTGYPPIRGSVATMQGPPPSYPSAAGLPSLAGIAMPPPPTRVTWLTWVLAGFGAIGIVVGVVVVTVKLMQPAALVPVAATQPTQATTATPTTTTQPTQSTTAATQSPAQSTVPTTPAGTTTATTQPAGTTAATTQPTGATPPAGTATATTQPATPPAGATTAQPTTGTTILAPIPTTGATTPAKPATPTKLTGVLSVEAASVLAGQRGTIVDTVAVGAKLERDAAVAHVRLYSAAYNQAYAKLVSLQRKYGDSEEYADFIDQARQEFASARSRRQLRAIAATGAGRVTRVAVKPGAETTERTVIAEIAIARITVPVAAVDGVGKRCTADLGGEQVTGNLLAIGSTERTLELDKVPSAKPGEIGDVKIHCAAE